MHQKKESLGELLDNSIYYKKQLLKELGDKKLEKSTLVRYYFSNYQFYRKKFEDEKLNENKINYKKNFKNFWNLYSSKVSVSNTTERNKNPDFYQF